jgi:hypothetical protein
MEDMVNNPALLDLMARGMRNPAMRARLETAMTAQGFGPSMSGSIPVSTSPSGTGSMAGTNTNIPISPSSSSSTVPRPPSQGNDQDQTEEDMIAEALRRSLEES